MSKTILEILKEHFTDQEFTLEKVDYGGPVHAFFIKTTSEEILEATWEKIRNMIGVYFQSKLEAEYDIWNIYLLFITPEAINRDLKHKIEHDTMSSRKIVIDGHPKINEADFTSFLFSEHITNNNLKAKVEDQEKLTFTKNITLSAIIDPIELTKIKKNKEEVLGEALNKIENLDQNEI